MAGRAGGALNGTSKLLLGVASALMKTWGCQGGTKIPFGRVVVMLIVDSNVSMSKQPFPAAAVSWLGHPLVHIIKNVTLEGSTAMLCNHIGNSIADVMMRTSSACSFGPFRPRSLS